MRRLYPGAYRGWWRTVPAGGARWGGSGEGTPNPVALSRSPPVPRGGGRGQNKPRAVALGVSALTPAQRRRREVLGVDLPPSPAAGDRGRARSAKGLGVAPTKPPHSLLSTLLTVTLIVLAPDIAQAKPTISTAPALAKIRPTQPLPSDARPAASIELTAARGECEAAQIVVSAGDAIAKRVEASATPLTAAHGAGHVAIALYREAFIDAKTASNTEGALGLWPDALIPTIDAIAHEPRNAFPIDVPARQHQPIYVEVCVPSKAAAGFYSGEVVLSGSDLKARVPIKLDVRPVTIPATSSLTTTFGLSGRSLLFGHYGEKRDDAERLKLVHRYTLAALRHRISLHAMSMIPPTVSKQDGKVDVDFTQWDQEIAPYLNGSPDADGAKFTAIDLRTPENLTESDRADYLKTVQQHFRERGWIDRLFSYVMDEPKPPQRDELLHRLDALTAAPRIARMVTIPIQDSLIGKVNVWVPNLNCLEYKVRPREFCTTQTPRESYDKRLAQGDKLWWYQSCSSHGCKSGPFGDAAVDRYFTGWPSYMVDIDGASARVMGWQAFTHRIGGELYFDTVYAYNANDKSKPDHADPWDSVWAFGGNGDGTLFYPGRPDRIGGETDVPVESIRLKHIRDGLEDYELLHLLASRGPEGERQAGEIASVIAPKLYQFEHSPTAYADARRKLFTALEKNPARAENHRGTQ